MGMIRRAGRALRTAVSVVGASLRELILFAWLAFVAALPFLAAACAVERHVYVAAACVGLARGLRALDRLAKGEAAPDVVAAVQQAVAGMVTRVRGGDGG